MSKSVAGHFYKNQVHFEQVKQKIKKLEKKLEEVLIEMNDLKQKVEGKNIERKNQEVQVDINEIEEERSFIEDNYEPMQRIATGINLVLREVYSDKNSFWEHFCYYF